uniref:Uncharacterized protein C4D7.07c n=1 Tax=Lygus hesperus TaxID=30085 RepID=A0A0A9WDU1_LYGHE
MGGIHYCSLLSYCFRIWNLRFTVSQPPLSLSRSSLFHGAIPPDDVTFTQSGVYCVTFDTLRPTTLTAPHPSVFNLIQDPQRSQLTTYPFTLVCVAVDFADITAVQRAVVDALTHCHYDSFAISITTFLTSNSVTSVCNSSPYPLPGAMYVYAGEGGWLSATSGPTAVDTAIYVRSGSHTTAFLQLYSPTAPSFYLQPLGIYVALHDDTGWDYAAPIDIFILATYGTGVSRLPCAPFHSVPNIQFCNLTRTTKLSLRISAYLNSNSLQLGNQIHIGAAADDLHPPYSPIQLMRNSIVVADTDIFAMILAYDIHFLPVAVFQITDFHGSIVSNGSVSNGSVSSPL